MLSEALSFEVDAVGVVDEAIEDCVGDGGISDNFVPAIDGQLAGDDDRTSFISVFDDLEQIAALIGVERLRSPVIKNEQIETSDSTQHLGITAIGAAECKGREETWHAMVRNCEVVPTSLVAEGASEPALADAAQSRDIVPRNSLSRLLSDIRIIHLPGSGSLSFVGSSMQV